MVRPPDAGRDLAEAGAELVTAALLRPETLDDALRGVRAVIATANVVTPTHRGSCAASADSPGAPWRTGA